LTSNPDIASLIFDSASFKRLFVMQTEKNQVDFVSRFHAKLL